MSGRIPGVFETEAHPRGRVDSAALFARVLEQAKPVLELPTTAKIAHCPLQRTGKVESRGVHSAASILAGRGEKNGVIP